jgi:glycerol uptake facilitator-like aquaporin
MFIFVFLQACTKQPTGIHLQITFVLMMGIPMCMKMSGAHFNPAITVSNYLCLFNKNKFSYGMMWMYFKAQLYGSFAALGLGYMLNDGFLAGLAIPGETVGVARIILS